MNAAWIPQSTKSREQMIEEARLNDWKIADRACRMCSSQYSSKIENDPVHNKWMPAAYPDVARWRGKKLHFGPRPFFGVSYSGFYDYEAGHGTSLRWSSGPATIKFQMPEGTVVAALGLKLRSVGSSSPVVIRVNGLEIFAGEIGQEWEYRQELAGLVPTFADA